MKEEQSIRKNGFLHRSVNSIAVLGLMLLLGSCTYQLSGLLAASGYGDTISQEVIDSEPRPPKQVVFQFDEHRYIENDPSGGFVGGCQGEMYYVDEKLGIKTRFGGNKTHNPRGPFKVNSPYVVVTDQENTYVSFDQGRSFILSPINGSDIVVQGNYIYAGAGAGNGADSGLGILTNVFHERHGIYVGFLNEATKTVDVIYESDRSRKSKVTDAPYLAIARAANPTQFFVCKDLPWRPSVKREREQAKASATQNGGAKP